MAVAIDLRSALARLTLDLIWASRRLGTAIAARIAIMATTISSSTRVKPLPDLVCGLLVVVRKEITSPAINPIAPDRVTTSTLGPPKAAMATKIVAMVKMAKMAKAYFFMTSAPCLTDVFVTRHLIGNNKKAYTFLR